MTEWYLRKSDGKVYGPVGLADLQAWATEGRIEPGDKISEDRARWLPPEQLPDLQLDYVLLLDQDTTYGPVHLAALQTLWCDENVPPTTHVRHTGSAVTKTLAEWLLPLLLENNQQVEKQLHTLQTEVDRLQAEVGAQPASPTASTEAGPSQAEWAARLTDEQTAYRELETRCAQLEYQLKTLTGLEHTWAQERDALQAQLNAVEADKKDLQARLEQSAPDQESAWMQERNNLQAQLDASEAAKKDLQARLDEQLQMNARGEESDWMQERDTLQAQLEAKTQELDTLKGDAPGGQRHLNSQVDEMRQHLQEATDELAKEKAQREQMERKHLQLSKSYRELNARYIQLRQGQPAPVPPTPAPAEQGQTTPEPESAKQNKPKLRLT